MRIISRMRIVTLAFLFALCIVQSAFGATHNFQQGKLLDVTTDERLDEGTSFRRAIFTVQIGDIIYTLKGERVSPHKKDYSEGLIIGDSIQASVEGDDVILLKPNGKDLKTSILKRERAKAQ
jgi:hypothetical protein